MFVPRFPPFVFLSGIDRCFDGIHKFSRFSLLVYTHIVCICIYLHLYYCLCVNICHIIPYHTAQTMSYDTLHCIASHCVT